MKSNSDHMEVAEMEQKELKNIIQSACQKIAPLWPLENFVAVNPYLGFSENHFSKAANELATVSDIQLTMPISYYLEKINEGKISREDIASVLNDYKSKIDTESFLEEVMKQEEPTNDPSVHSVVDLAYSVSDTDWNRYMVSRISSWASSYFDKGQAVWNASYNEGDMFASWKSEAMVDRSPVICGLKSFRKRVAELPDDYSVALEMALDILKISDENAISIYFHRLLRNVGGWSAYLAYLDWEEKLSGSKQEHLEEFLAILVCWEACFFQSINNADIEDKWVQYIKNLSSDFTIRLGQQELAKNMILQDALDLATQKNLIAKFKNKNVSKAIPKATKAQTIFCIDVRSEVFRRNLEQVDGQIDTLGFAGFFGFPISFVPLGSEKEEAQSPVLLKPGITIKEEIKDVNEHANTVSGRITKRQMKKTWSSFKTGAVSSFGFVSPLGLSFLPKLFSDSYGWTRPVANPNDFGMQNEMKVKRSVSLRDESTDEKKSGIPLDQQVQMAAGALKAMSLTENFARFVMFMGHGSTTVNNPHSTGLDCGACGGHTGEANAKVAAAILNDFQVRAALHDQGIKIPEETVFVACLHDTTTDEITIFNEDQLSKSTQEELIELKKSFEKAGQLSRTERSLRMDMDKNGNIDEAVKMRSKDWSQVRPEWGLAGCSTFVVAQREHTSDINLEGKSFLHSYEWKKDKDFTVLEQIMTAPMIVTSWINLQYYASSVDNQKLGAGNKTLHNVTAGLGVIEGASGDLRTGLPWQSVHDGTDYQHEPTRLSVIIEAPKGAINAVLEKHKSVRDLCDNEWIGLMTMNSEGKVSHRYRGNFNWEPIS